MSTLICNAAEGLLQIVLMRDNAVVCAQEWPAPTRSTEILAPALAHMLQELGMQPQDISRIACVYGPGSFTGIRLVLSTAAALRRAIGASVAPLDYMEALALSAYLRLQDLPHSRGGAENSPNGGDTPAGHPKPSGSCTEQEARNTVQDDSLTGHIASAEQADTFMHRALSPRKLWVLTHARRNLVHCQPFSLPSPHEHIDLSTAQAGPQALDAVDMCSLEVCAQRINAMPATSLCVGSGLLRNQDYFYEHCPQAHFGGPSYGLVRLAALVQLAQHASYAQQDLTPLYIRPCDAVENLPAMAQKLGQDAATAEQRLTALLARPTRPDQTYRPA